MDQRTTATLSLKHSCIFHSDLAYKKQNKRHLGTKIKSKLKFLTTVMFFCFFLRFSFRAQYISHWSQKYTANKEKQNQVKLN